jgi:hypothetical protein
MPKICYSKILVFCFSIVNCLGTLATNIDDACLQENFTSCDACLNRNVYSDCIWCETTKNCLNSTLLSSVIEKTDTALFLGAHLSQFYNVSTKPKSNTTCAQVVRDARQCPRLLGCLLKSFSLNPYACKIPAIMGFWALFAGSFCFLLEIYCARRLELLIYKRSRFVNLRVENPESLPCTRCGYQIESRGALVDPRTNECIHCTSALSFQRDITAYILFLPIGWIFWLFSYESTGFSVFVSCGPTAYIVVLSFLNITTAFFRDVFNASFLFGGDIELKYLDHNSNTVLVSSIKNPKFRERISCEMNRSNERLLWAEESRLIDSPNIKWLFFGILCFSLVLLTAGIAHAVVTRFDASSRLILGVTIYLFVIVVLSIYPLTKKNASVITTERFMKLSYSSYNTILASIILVRNVKEATLSSLYNNFEVGSLEIFAPMTKEELKKKMEEEKEGLYFSRKSKTALFAFTPVKTTVALTRCLVNHLKFTHFSDEHRERQYAKLSKWLNIVVFGLALLAAGLFGLVIWLIGPQHVFILIGAGGGLLGVAFVIFWFYFTGIQSYMQLKYENPNCYQPALSQFE